VLGLAALAGCAGKAPPQPDHDPWERYNRKMFAFNDWLDRNALEPIARGWDYVVPKVVQRRITDFTNMLRFPGVFINTILQGKPRETAVAVARLQINLFLGGLGFYDLANDFGLPPQNEDFGQTFGVWGIAPGPYLVLPVLGPSSPRDTVGLVGDFAADFYQYFIVVPGVTTGVYAINVVNQRARLLDTVERIKEASLDYYVAVRNGYVQRRYRLIHDEAPPTGQEEEDLYDADVFESVVEEGNEQ
jgi:phospholipid-binding lipoprotein MlaA